VAGLGLTIYYIAINSIQVRDALGLTGNGVWFGILPVSAGVFGISAGTAVIVLVSLLSRPAATTENVAPLPDTTRL